MSDKVLRDGELDPEALKRFIDYWGCDDAPTEQEKATHEITAPLYRIESYIEENTDEINLQLSDIKSELRTVNQTLRTIVDNYGDYLASILNFCNVISDALVNRDGAIVKPLRDIDESIYGLYSLCPPCKR